MNNFEWGLFFGVINIVSFFALVCMGGLWLLALWLKVKKRSKYSKYVALIALLTTLLGISSIVKLPETDPYITGLIFLLFPATDWTLTKLALDRGATESNPIMAFLIRKFGIYWTLPIIIIALVFVLKVVWFDLSTSARFSIYILYIVTVINNIIELIKYDRKHRGVET
jgi:hypothetical protein